MMTKVWVVVEYGGDVGYTIIGATNDEDYAEKVSQALGKANSGKRYEKECVDYLTV